MPGDDYIILEDPTKRTKPYRVARRMYTPRGAVKAYITVGSEGYGTAAEAEAFIRARIQPAPKPTNQQALPGTIASLTGEQAEP